MSAGERPDPSLDADPETVARGYLAAFDSADPDTIAAWVSADFVNVHTAALGEGCEGRDTYRRRLVGFLADMVGLHYEVEDLVSADDRVMVTYTLTATWQGATPITVRGAQRLEVHDGLITHRTDYWDAKGFLDQLT